MTDDALLHDELMMLPDYFPSISKEKKLGLKKITKISTVCQLLNAQQIGKTMFYEYCKLITLYLTVPVTTATAERSFSVLNRIKTYLRCTMSQQPRSSKTTTVNGRIQPYTLTYTTVNGILTTVYGP